MELITRSLGPRELALVEAREADRRRALTLDDVQRDIGPGTTRNAAAVMAARLIWIDGAPRPMPRQRPPVGYVHE